MSKKKIHQIPFDDEGNLMSYPSRKSVRNPDTGVQQTWVPNFRANYEFEATLTYNGFDNGIRSAHRIIWQDEEGHTYPMFISQLGRALDNVGMVGKTMTGRWTFMKQGQNFSICAVKVEKPSIKKPKKRKKPTVVTARDKAIEHLQKQVTRLQVWVDAWEDIAEEVISGSVYVHIKTRVNKVMEKSDADR